MRALCIICSELFLASSDVSATPCGHIFHHDCLNQWLAQSKTCPQCRARILRQQIIQKLYIDAGPDAEAEEDPETLRSKVNELEAELTQATESLHNSEMLHAVAESTLMKEQEYSDSMKLQLQFFSVENKRLAGVEKENTSLKSKIRQYTDMETLLNGTSKEMTETLEKYVGRSPDCQDLAKYLGVIKQHYAEAVKSKQDIKQKEKLGAIEITRLDKKLRAADGSIQRLQRELKTAKDKIESQQERLDFYKTKVSPAKRRIKDVINCSSDWLESPEAGIISKKTNKENGRFPLFKECSVAVGLATGQVSTLRKSPSVKLGESASALETSSELEALPDFNIMKRLKPTLLKASTMTVRLQKFNEQAYNGLGGHSKLDTFPEPNCEPRRQPKKARTGGPAAAAARTRTLVNYIIHDDDSE